MRKDTEITIITNLIALILAILIGYALVYGVNKTLDNMDRTYYDKELGRTVYVEEGV